MLGLNGQEEAVGRRVFLCAVPGQLVVKVERASGIAGCADIEQAREMGEIVGHWKSS